MYDDLMLQGFVLACVYDGLSISGTVRSFLFKYGLELHAFSRKSRIASTVQNKTEMKSRAAVSTHGEMSVHQQLTSSLLQSATCELLLCSACGATHFESSSDSWQVVLCFALSSHHAAYFGCISL